MHLQAGRLTRYLCIFMAIYLFNLCVDSPYKSAQQLGSILYNEQESIIELVVEKILGYENVIPEHEDDTSQDYKNSKNPSVFNLMIEYHNDQLTYFFLDNLSNPSTRVRNLKTLNFIEIDAPPPKV